MLDVLEGRVIENDRQVEALHVFEAKDRRNPRVEVEVHKIPSNYSGCHGIGCFRLLALVLEGGSGESISF